MTDTSSRHPYLLSSIRTADGKGIVQIEDRFDTAVDRVWSALTDPERLARWLGEFKGDLRRAGRFHARFFASDWHGTGRVDGARGARVARPGSHRQSRCSVRPTANEVLGSVTG